MIKTSIFGAIFTKPVNFGSNPDIFRAKTDPFIPFGVNSFEYFEHIGIQIIEKTNWLDCKLCLNFWQSTGLKKPVGKPSPLFLYLVLIHPPLLSINTSIGGQSPVTLIGLFVC